MFYKIKSEVKHSIYKTHLNLPMQGTDYVDDECGDDNNRITLERKVLKRIHGPYYNFFIRKNIKLDTKET